MITYTDKIKDLKPEQLVGFFVGWPHPPSTNTHLKILQNSFRCILAMDGMRIVGFINAISDGILSVYIPLLEVLPQYQKKGVGSKLVKMMLEELSDFYLIDLVCDDKVKYFYKKFGMQHFNAMGIRNMDCQNGEKK